MGQQAATKPFTVTVSDRRPIVYVLDSLQQRFLTPITFEEVPYENDADLPDRSTVINGNVAKLHLGPAIVDFTITFDSSDATPYLASQTLLAEHRRRMLPGEYKAVQQEGRVDVVPVQVLGRDGRMRDVEPLMSRPITFPLERRPVDGVLRMVIDQVAKESGSKFKLIYAPFPTSLTVETSAEGESAADVISGLSPLLKVPLTFRCLYDASDRTYYLTVQVVVPASQ